MNIIHVLLIIILSYALGSISTAVWAGKIFHKTDVREHGSGNAGATNTIRILGWATGIPVLLIDLAKGWLAASLPLILNFGEYGMAEQVNLQILGGLIAIIGHVFPIFAGFKGGKGVATTFGVLLSLHPALTLSCMAVFLIVLLISGYVSISSISAGLSFPVLLQVFFESPSKLFNIFAMLIAMALIITHKQNISRLIKGEENRFIWKNRGRRRKADVKDEEG